MRGGGALIMVKLCHGASTSPPQTARRDPPAREVHARLPQAPTGARPPKSRATRRTRPGDPRRLPGRAADAGHRQGGRPNPPTGVEHYPPQALDAVSAPLGCQNPLSARVGGLLTPSEAPRATLTEVGAG